ncbi:MAG TPA: hypothetical protein VH914_17010 [Acidimicrobiia bacterium]|jgi:hypothetical protein|nr:hypothetical protein [Acidimicrobiia bacterium]
MTVRRALAAVASAAIVLSAFAATPANAEGPPPTVALAPRSGRAGRQVTITGSGFTPGDLLRVRYVTGLASPERVTLCKVLAGPGGTLACKPRIPIDDAGPIGRHHVTVVDVTHPLAAHAVAIFRLR